MELEAEAQLRWPTARWAAERRFRRFNVRCGLVVPRCEHLQPIAHTHLQRDGLAVHMQSITFNKRQRRRLQRSRHLHVQWHNGRDGAHPSIHDAADVRVRPPNTDTADNRDTNAATVRDRIPERRAHINKQHATIEIRHAEQRPHCHTHTASNKVRDIQQRANIHTHSRSVEVNYMHGKADNNTFRKVEDSFSEQRQYKHTHAKSYAHSNKIDVKQPHLIPIPHNHGDCHPAANTVTKRDNAKFENKNTFCNTGSNGIDIKHTNTGQITN